MTQGYEDFRAQYCANLPTAGYDGDFEMTIIHIYIMTLERALEQAETRADDNYADLMDARGKLTDFDEIKGEW